MASNPYVNKVKYGDQTVMDISDSTASESDVAAGEIFYKANGARSVGTASSNYYSPTDATSTDIDDADYIPFYDNSASAKKNSLWSNIKAKLNEVFFRRSENSILGAKNLLPYPYGSGSSATSGGVTYTVDADGIVTATNSATGESTFFLEGTAWGYANYIDADKILKPNTEYTLTAGIENDSNIYVHAILTNSSGTNVTVWRTRADSEKTQTTPADLTGLRLACWIRINANTTISNPIKFYPMLRLASDTDGTYEPFAMTNQQLTDALGTKADVSSLATVATSGDYGDLENTPTLADVAISGSYNDLEDTPTIPDELADLSDDATHRLVTDTEKSTWDGKQDELTFDNIPTANSSNPVKSGGVYTTFELLQTSKAENSIIAPVEGSTTASQAYAIGEHFIRNGAFCTAIAAIASGATLTLNTNYVTGDVATDMSYVMQRISGAVKAGGASNQQYINIADLTSSRAYGTLLVFAGARCALVSFVGLSNPTVTNITGTISASYNSGTGKFVIDTGSQWNHVGYVAAGSIATYGKFTTS